MSSLLLIGGSGFFGKSFLDAYQRGLLKPWGIREVIILSRNATELKYTNPDLVDASIKFVNSDISRAEEIPNADYIIHAAASTDASRYLSHGPEEQQNILAATHNYCKLAKIKHSKSKIVYTSSGAVYGQQPEGMESLSESYDPGSVEHMHVSKQHYAAAKREAELAMQMLAHDGLKVSIARCFAFVGGHLPRNKHFAIGNFIEDGLNNRPIKVKATHSVYRSYMYSDDLVRWLMTIADNSSNTCPIYNVGSDEPILIGDLAKKIGEFFNVPLEVPIVSAAVTDRYIPCIDRAKALLNLRLNFSLDEAIYRTISFILKERNH